jgi:hypothetical protein
MNLINRSALALGCFLLIAFSASVQAAAPAKPPTTPVQTASAALLKEYQDVMKDKKGEGLREKCDYFTVNKTEGLTPEMILAVLEKAVSPDPRADAYVKWQLLSGIENKFPDTLKARAIKVYRSAPLPPRSHPGMDHPTMDRLLNRNVGIKNQEAETPVNNELAAKIKEYREIVEPTLAYRDELFSRLSPGFDTLVSAYADLYVRVSTGAPANEFWKTVSTATRSWALTSSESANMMQIAGAIEKLRTFVKDDRNKPYYRVIWAKEDKFTGLKWQSEPTIQNDKSMEEVSNWLIEHAKNPAGGLNFKDPKK